MTIARLALRWGFTLLTRNSQARVCPLWLPKGTAIVEETGKNWPRKQSFAAGYVRVKTPSLGP